MMDRSKLANVISKRLSKLRADSGKSRPELRKELNERYRGDKDFISKDALLNYEGSGLYSSRDGKAAGMNVTTLVAFAEYYNVSTDYILGLREEKTPDASIQGVCETTGLSEDAVNWISNLDEVSTQYLDILLNSETFRLMLSYLELAPLLNTSVKLFQYTVDQISKGNPPTSFELVENDMHRLEELPTIDINEEELAESYYRHAETAQLRRDVHEYKFSQLATELYKQFSSLEDFPRYNKNEEVE